MVLALSELLAGLPPEVRVSADDVVAARERAGDHTVYVVLDDDPTGTQSVADLPVLTHWEPDDFRWAFSTGKPAVYVMTNTRSLAPADAERVNRECVAAALEAATDRPVAFVSRSDSTLRGHFPLEPDVIADELSQHDGRAVDGVVIVPAFGDAGRITVRGTHYAGSPSSGYRPVGETQFARDATFGYEASRLADWVEEKTDGKVPASTVLELDLTTLRTNRDATVALLRSAHDRQPVVVDIVTEADLRLLALALIEAEQAGSTFVYRVGPPFVRARIGQAVRPPVTPDEVRASRGSRQVATGGLVCVGSHVQLTTDQLDHLRSTRHPDELELEVTSVIDPARRDAHVADIAARAARALDEGTCVVRTSRTLVTGTDGDASLAIARAVSAALVDVVRRILAANPPRFVVAKGGITSSDIATHGLGFRRADVIGPMLPGIVSLWSGQDGPAAGIPFVVFAGNVGEDRSLADVVDTLSQA
ncbi:four-carbon acid sugar kinase family protein [uncultured Tessaracoccus sp.]|uniref:four-carbon acid sugar kinase family protein n=1 Tax=uncultured Tessaracoccus sp. TaxID=905023 RepID=UPI0025FD0FB8|nr:four-carbon acid sugar kinase family protein [uncultured Tessaracoccus sp.]